VITPARDEEAHIEETIRSVADQTITPVEWVIVDDGSQDGTASIIARYARLHPWITAVNRPNRGCRKAGTGVVEAFNDGLAALRTRDWDFLAKLDGDLSFERGYFEECFARFRERPQLGIAGGSICYVTNGVKTMETCPAFHVRGATKIYRRACWDSIGGLWPAPGWDTMDEVKANRMGWSTETFSDLHLVHHRKTGSADGLWGGLVKNGRANYVCGYHPLFMLTKCAKRLFERPYVIGSVALLYGFLTGYLKRIPQVRDPETIGYLRRQQMGRLLGRETIWR
jgi:glycosyltransferase involved in cell wall biosynthesis